MSDTEIGFAIGGREVRIRLDLSSPMHCHILEQLKRDGAYEPPTQSFLMQVLRPDDAFIDIGAHIGFFSLLAAILTGGNGRVIAVEPAPDNLARLAGHVAVNALDTVDVVAAAASDRDGRATIHLNRDNDGGHALWDPGRHPLNPLSRDDPDTAEVRSVTVATLMDEAELAGARVVKIDTEGGEARVLEGARRPVAAGRIDFIVAEVHAFGLGELGSDEDALFALARGMGLEVHLPHAEGGRPVPLDAGNRPDRRYVYNVILARPEMIAATWSP